MSEILWRSPEWYKAHPIYLKKEDFDTKSTKQLLEECRSRLAKVRGELDDIGHTNPRLSSDLESAQDSLTCLIVYLYNIVQRAD